MSLKKIFLASVSVFIILSVHAQGFLKASGQQIVNEKGENVLLRGIGLGGWMLQEGYMLRINKDGQQNKIRARIDSIIGPWRTKEFYTAWLQNHTRKSDVDSLHAWGFNSIRLPMHYNLYTLAVDQEKIPGQNTWLTEGFALTDSLLAWCSANHMYLILDMHAAPGGQGNDLNISDRDATKLSLWESAANRKKLVDLWAQLAHRYAHEPWIGGYDIINEPNWGFDDLTGDKNGLKEKHNAPLKELMIEITAAIRREDKDHIIIIEGNGWGNNYNGILPAWDNNMVLSFHKYWNYNNTESIRHILDTRSKNNIPVWIGETGENSNVWFTEAIRLMENNNLGWAWWPLKKIGANNPMQIKSNPDYDQLVAYLNGVGPNPGAEVAYSGLMQFARSARTENTIIHRDVVDAMFRQPFSPTAIPFKQNVVRNGAVLQAVDYDMGPNGIAYFDKDTADYHVSQGPRGGNSGRTYRNDGVDIKRDSSATESYYVTNTEDGEWLRYTIDVTKKGTYTIQVLVASLTGGQMSLLINNQIKPFTVDIPVTAGLLNWQPVTIKNVSLNKGKQVLRLLVNKGGFNISTISFHTDKVFFSNAGFEK